MGAYGSTNNGGIRPVPCAAAADTGAQLTFLYLICFLDRTNIGNAKIAGLTTDVPMTTNQYNDTLSIFFVSYAVFEALSNFLLKRLRASYFIPTLMWVPGLGQTCSHPPCLR